MSNPFKVLLVEDMKIARLAFKSSVSSLGWHIDMAETAHEAINCCNQHDYDVVLMDIGLPDMSGIEATMLIKQQHPTLPIIALSAHFDDDTQQAALTAGMNGFLQKPFSLDQVAVLYQMLG